MGRATIIFRNLDDFKIRQRNRQPSKVNEDKLIHQHRHHQIRK